MRGHVAGFDEWYAPVEDELGESPVARWAKDFRNRVEKQGDPGPRSNVIHIHDLDTSMLTRSAPPGTVSTIIGDHLGSNYWVVRLSDGTEENLYFNLASEVGRSSIVFSDAPAGRDVQDLMNEHLRRLETIVVSAEDRFVV